MGRTAGRHTAVAWVSLDVYDNQPWVFWSNVRAAPRRAPPVRRRCRLPCGVGRRIMCF